MRKRLVPALLGTALLIGAPVAFGSPAHAIPPPTPVDITSPGAMTGHALNFLTPTTPPGGATDGTRLQPFVAQESGPLSSLSVKLTGGNSGLTARVYADDQLSLDTPNGLPHAEANLYLGDSLGTATTAATSYQGGVETAAFTPNGALTAGHTYWVVMYNVETLGAEFKSNATAYWNSGSQFDRTTYDYFVDVDVDVTPVGVALSPAAPDGAHGWYTAPVTATYTCTTHVDVCPSSANIGTDGTDSPSGTVTLDDGDSSFAWFHTLKVDRTDPTIVGTLAPLGSGFRVTWTCADTTSGIDTCPAPTDVSGVGSDTSATGEAVDLAGNTKSATVSGLVAAHHLPTITIHGVTPGKTYAHGTKLSPTCTTSGPQPGLRAGPAPAVTCTGVTTKKTNASGSVTWKYTATAVDPAELGGTTIKSVSWIVAAKMRATHASFVVKGLSKTTKHGYPVIDHTKTYQVSFVFKDKNGHAIKGKPIWLHSVVTNADGTKGKPTHQMFRFHKVHGVWTKTFVPGYDYAGHYRKFGVIDPNGKRHYVVVYVK